MEKHEHRNKLPSSQPSQPAHVPTLGIQVELRAGPINPQAGAVLCYDYSYLYGVYGDMSQVPEAPYRSQVVRDEVEYSVDATEQSPNALHYLSAKDWTKDESSQKGIKHVIAKGLELASDLGIQDVVVPLPSCCSQFYFRDIGGLFDEDFDSEELSEEEFSEFIEYLQGIKEFLDSNHSSSIRCIQVVYDSEYPIGRKSKPLLEELRVLPDQIQKGIGD